MPRGKLLKRYQERNPEKNYEEENALYEDINAEMDEMDSFKQKTTETNEKLVEVLRSHPEVAAFIRDLAKGSGVEEALARNFDLDGIAPAEGEPDFEAWNKGIGERKAALKEVDDYRNSVNENAIVSGKTMAAFVAKNEISEEKAIEFAQMVDKMLVDAVDGKIEEATLTALYTAVTHDEVVEGAVEKAKVGAKNAIIEDEMKELEASKKGDGLPNISSGAGKKPRSEEATDPFSQAIKNQRKI